MKKTLLILTLVIVLTLPLVSQKGYKEETFFSMDTVITLKVKGDKKLLSKAKDVIEKSNDDYDAYQDNSKISQLNKTGEIAVENTEIFSKAKEFYEATEGLFDPTVKPLTDLWNITGENPVVPEESQIKSALKKVNGENLVIKDKVYLKDGARIDLGGIAKGFATDEAVKVLKEQGCENFVLNLGGNIYAYSKKKPLKVGVQEPFSERGELLYTLEINDAAVVSSGTYERCFQQDSKQYHHIFDTRTGYPSESGISQVTVVGKDCTMCDAFSTAILVGGEELARKLQKKYDFQYIIVSDKALRISSGIEIFDLKNGYVVK